MKIAICGKGGSGKSTITTLLAKELAREGNKVLVVDSDESNYGLHKQLGMALPKDFTAFFGGKEKVLRDMMLSNFACQFFDGAWKLSDIPAGYCEEKDGVCLMASGKIHQANEGCSCPMNNVIAQFISNLQLAQREYAILDMEAGIEHFGRGVDNGVDAIIMVVDPSYESLRLTKKILELGQSIGKPVYFVLNKVTDASRDAMLDAVAERSLVAAIVPAEDAISTAGLTGQELTVSNSEIQALVKRLQA